MGTKRDLTGQKFFRLTVLHDTGLRGSGGGVMWRCRCDCGKEVTLIGQSLTSSNTLSCGCWGKELRRLKPSHVTHGGTNTREYGIWCQVKRRCLNPKDKLFRYYGARGISVCDRWRNSFENFLADMGTAPSAKHSIDRINNDGNYEPGNCRWATQWEQCRNHRGNRWIEFRGERRILQDWAAHVGIGVDTISERLRRGWSIEDALTRPVQRQR